MKNQSQVRKQGSNSALPPQSAKPQPRAARAGEKAQDSFSIARYETSVECTIQISFSSAEYARFILAYTESVEGMTQPIDRATYAKEGIIAQTNQHLHISAPIIAGRTVEQGANPTVGPIEFESLQFTTINEALFVLNKRTKQSFTLEGFALYALLQEAHRVLFPGHPLIALEDAVYESVALINTLVNRCIEHSESVDASDFQDAVTTGLINLAQLTSGRLLKAAYSAHNYATGRAS